MMIVRLSFLVTASITGTATAAYFVYKQLIHVKTPKPLLLDTPTTKPNYEYGLRFDKKLQSQGGDHSALDDGLEDLVFIGLVEWADLPRDILVLIAKRAEYFEDFCNLRAVCKSWRHSITSILGKFQTLPSYFPWIMLTDKAEINYPKVTRGMDTRKILLDQVRKNEQIEGMHNRQFFSFSASKAFEFELPEATRKKCLGVGYGLLLTLDYDLQINILNPFTRQQIRMPNMLSFKSQVEGSSPQLVIQYFVLKVAMSSNPYKLTSNREDCIIMAIYGKDQVLAFARLGDKVWTDICLARAPIYEDVAYYNGKFYAVNQWGCVDVCDINGANESKVTPIACLPEYVDHNYKGCRKDHHGYRKYLVELSGDLLVLIRYRKGFYYDDKQDKDKPYNYTVGFSIFKLEKSPDARADKDGRGDKYPYKLTKVHYLGNKALFIGSNPSVSVPCSRFVKANSIYFSDDDVTASTWQPRGGGYDTGIYDVKSGNITLHNIASKSMSLLNPPTWIIS